MGSRPSLRRASSIPGLAAAFEGQRRRVLALLPEAVVTHVGGSSMPALLTRGDLDIHVRVEPEGFAAAVSALAAAYSPYRPGMWTDAFAAFADDACDPPVGVALTAIGGEHDTRFTSGWRRLREEPALVEELNDLKSRHAGGDPEEYEVAKSAFFDRLASPDQRR